MGKITNFTEGRIFSPLIKFTLPVLLSLFLQALYGATDLLIVGQFGDSSSVSAVAIGSQFMHLVTVIVNGLAMGMTILLGQRVGEKKLETAANIIGTSICFFTILSVVISLGILFMSEQLAVVMNTPEEAYEKTVYYLAICSSGVIFIVMFNVISSIFRGFGNSVLPLIFVGIASVINVLGDLLLIGVFQLDVIGAAIATVLAQIVSAVISLWTIIKTGMPFPFSKKQIRLNKKVLTQILKMGAPIAFQSAMTSISFLIITAIMNSLGLVASAAVGVGEKVSTFIMLIPMSYMQSVSVFVAQNIGADKPDRAKKTLLYAIITSFIFGLTMFIITFWHGEIFAKLFCKEIPVIIACTDYLRSYAFDCLLVSFLFCFMGYFNGCGKTLFVMLQGICAAFFVRIPFSYFMSKVPGVSLMQIGLATPLATLFSIFICFGYIRYLDIRCHKKNCVSN